MLRTLFNKAAKPPYLPETPVVLVSTLGDDSTRGDSHGYIGMGKIVAEKLGGSYHYVDESVLRDRFPKIDHPELRLNAFISEIGTPDIVFSRCHHDYEDHNDFSGKTPYLINQINENLVPFFSSLRDLVAHHLTPTLLEEEGKKFEAAYPNLPHPLVAVMMTGSPGRTLPEILPNTLQYFGQSTVFICTSRRTEQYYFEKMTKELNVSLNNLGLTDRVQILGYEFHTAKANNAYNPYMGLLNKADHIIVCGSSNSIVSESLATGKTVHLSECHNEYYPLIERGLVSDFNESAKNMPLETRAIKPLNRTEFLATRIVDQYRHKQQRKLGFFGAIGAYMMDG